jgi:hypothetical protein
MSTSIAKQQVMKARKPKVVNVESLEYVTNSHAVYQLLQKYGGGLSRSDLCTGLVHDKSDIKEQAIDNALLHLKDNGFIRAEISAGGGGHKLYYINEDVEYKPRKLAHKVARKVAPNDVKAQKAIRRMTRVKPVLALVEAQQALPLEKVNGAEPEKEVTVSPEAQPVQPQDANLKVTPKAQRKFGKFEFVQGMAALDPDSPHFGQTARELAKKVVGKDGTEFEPKAYMFFEFGEGSVVLTPKQAYSLYKELHKAFGQN